MKLFRKPRCDSYEASLTHEEREKLYAWLLQPGLSLRDACRRAPAWAGGKNKGRQPAEQAVAKIARRLRIGATMSELSAAATVEQAALTNLLQHVPNCLQHEEALDLAMKLISQEVITKTLGMFDSDSRNAGAKLMLQRSDQRLDREKYLLEVTKYQEAAQALKEKDQSSADATTGQGGIPPEIMAQVEKELRLL